jgi:hypothetical protein
MNSQVMILLVAVGGLQLKHYICDYVLQSSWQVQHKVIYGHPGGLLHAGLHCAGTVPVVLLFTRIPAFIATIFVCEFIIHYHSDWLKGRIDSVLGFTTKDWAYWVIFGTDQFAHQLTYLGILTALETPAVAAYFS